MPTSYTPPFKLNNGEREALRAVIHEERKTKGGADLDPASIGRALRRYDSGENRPKKGTATRTLLDTIYETDGLTLTKTGEVDSPFCSEDEQLEDIGEDAFDARDKAEELLWEGEMQTTFHRGDTPPGCDYVVQDSEEVWSGIVVKVRIKRLNAGDQYEEYDLEEGASRKFTVKRHSEIYAIYVTRIWVEK